MSLRAVVWCAVSTPQQAEDDRFSLPKQESDARAVCAERGWQIVDIIRIPGHSRFYTTIAEAAADMRQVGIDALDKFMAHIERRDFDILVVRDTDRFGRTQTMLSEVMERTYRTAGAKVYTLSSGLIEDNQRVFRIAVDGIGTATEIQRLVERRHAGMRAKIPRGIPTHKPPFSHILLRDGRGRAVGMKPDAMHRSAIHDAAVLLLEGVGWKHIEHTLHERFGHVHPDTNRPYPSGAFNQLLYNPMFWGNNTYGARTAAKRHRGLWVFDASETPPPGVTVFYGTHESALSDDLAERVKAEMRRRHDSVKGRMRPYGTTIFSGLLVCGLCKRRLSYHAPSRQGRHKDKYYVCPAQKGALYKCDNKTHTPVRKLKAQIEPFLETLIEGKTLDTLLYTDADSSAAQLQRIDDDITAVREQARMLIRQQAQNPGLADLYQDEIETVQDRLEKLTRQRRDIAATTDGITEVQRLAVEHLRQLPSIEAFWELSDLEINQRLHALLGAWKFVVLNGVVVQISVP